MPLRTIEGRHQETRITYDTWKEGDRVLVAFEEHIHQPGISKYQSNENHERTDFTTARTWKIGTIDMIGMRSEVKMAYVLLDKPYKGKSRGWVDYGRLQPYIPEVM
jgi:hypothetical protein